MNKTKKNCILGLLGLFVLMMSAASVSANEDDTSGILDRVDIDPDAFAENVTDDSLIGEEPNLIAPSPDTNEEPVLIAPRDIMENEEVLSGGNNFTTGFIIVIGISGFAGLVAALIIFKK